MYTAGWNVTITPLDTCGTVQLSGASYLSYLMGSSRIAQTLAQAQLYWTINGGGGGTNILQTTSIWYDSVATYMVVAPALLEFTTLSIEVTSDGYTIVSPTGTPITCALNWQDDSAAEGVYEAWLAAMLGAV